MAEGKEYIEECKKYPSWLDPVTGMRCWPPEIAALLDAEINAAILEVQREREEDKAIVDILNDFQHRARPCKPQPPPSALQFDVSRRNGRQKFTCLHCDCDFGSAKELNVSVVCMCMSL